MHGDARTLGRQTAGNPATRYCTMFPTRTFSISQPPFMDLLSPRTREQYVADRRRREAELKSHYMFTRLKVFDDYMRPWSCQDLAACVSMDNSPFVPPPPLPTTRGPSSRNAVACRSSSTTGGKRRYKRGVARSAASAAVVEPSGRRQLDGGHP